MIRRQTLWNGLWLTLGGWLAAQCVLQLSREPQPAQAPAVEVAPVPGLLIGHWQAPLDTGVLPLTRLPVEYLGGLRAVPLNATVVVLRYGQQVRSYRSGQRLAPGIVLHGIDEAGLIFDNQGRRERLPWPPRPAVTGFKRQG